MRPCVERNVTAAFRSISMLQSLPIGGVRCSTQATARLVRLRACTGPPPGAGVEPLVLRTRWKRQSSSKSPMLITARRVRTASALDGGLLLRALADGLGRLTSGQDAPHQATGGQCGPQSQGKIIDQASDAVKERSLPLPGGCWKLPSIRLHQE